MGWNITRQHTTAESYRAALFSPRRLALKFGCFEGVTAASMRSQKVKPGDRLRWVIIASSHMPEPWRERLERVARETAADAPSRVEVRLVWVDNMHGWVAARAAAVARVREEVGAAFATVRLDDDDGLGPLFCAKLSSYGANAGEIISFPKGHTFSATLNADGATVTFRRLRDVNKPYTALGLSRISDDIYAAGNHQKLKDKFRTRLDHSADMYALCCSEACDTKRSG